MPSTVDPVVEARFRSEAVLCAHPEDIVFVGSADSELLAALQRDYRQMRVLVPDEGGELAGVVRGDKTRTMALIDDPKLGARALQKLLATVRDLIANRLILHSSALVLADALALGFRCVDQAQGVFLFDLFDYKNRPEWFNAEHFAHPHRWDSTR